MPRFASAWRVRISISYWCPTARGTGTIINPICAICRASEGEEWLLRWFFQLRETLLQQFARADVSCWWRHSQNWIDDIRSPPQFMWSRFFIDALHDLGATARARIGIVGLRSVLRDPEGIMSHGEFTALEAAFPKASFECATDILYAVRKRKSAEEIALIEKAQDCADAIDAAFRQICTSWRARA